MAELLDLLNAYTEELKGIYGSKLLKVSLYGSYARGDNRQWSDVNVFVLVVLRRSWRSIGRNCLPQPWISIWRTGWIFRRWICVMRITENGVVSILCCGISGRKKW